MVGVLPGSDKQLASEYVVIGAHYDHLGLGGPESLAAKPEGQIHHGADDNASGTTGLLEIARLRAARRAGLLSRMRETIRPSFIDSLAVNPIDSIFMETMRRK